MINFTVGPVQMEEEIRKIGAEEIPYFRTPEFSALMKENESLMNRFMKAGEGARTVFLTGSGTAAMEAAVINLFTKQDRLLVVNGGSFGARFVRICQIHGIPYDEIRLEAGKKLTKPHLAPYAISGDSGQEESRQEDSGQGDSGQKESRQEDSVQIDSRQDDSGRKSSGQAPSTQRYTGFLVNVHETSTGVHYDMELISRFCRENRLWLIVDAISSFLADEFLMEKWGVDLVLTGSQKALALPPGIAAIVMNERTVKRVEESRVESLYFNLKDYLKDGERGQTPFTPAVSILIQMNRRLKAIEEKGLVGEQDQIKELAEDFRQKIGELPFQIVSESLSNAETPLAPTGKNADGSPVSAYRIFEILKDEYGIFVCPNGGELAEKVFRVGHIGNLTKEENQKLVDALRDMQDRGLL